MKRTYTRRYSSIPHAKEMKKRYYERKRISERNKAYRLRRRENNLMLRDQTKE